MILSAMPVLHARTHNIDFRTEKLLIEPEAFSYSDSVIIYKVATESTRQRALAPPCGRYVIYGSGTYSVVGRTVRFSELYSRCGKEPKYINVDKNNGRLAYGFVGLMIETGSQRDSFILSDELILDIYERCIKKRWEETENDKNAYDTMKVGFMDFDVQTKTTVADYEPLFEQSSDPIILEDTDDLREQIVYFAMSQALKGKCLSLCTSLSIFDKDIFSVVTCKDAASKIQEIDKAISQISHDDMQDTDQKEEKYRKRTYKKVDGKIIKEIGKNEKTLGVDKQVRSLDDLLSDTEAPDDAARGALKKNTGKSKGTIFDKGIILGTILGITFVVVEVAKNSSPVLIAFTAAATVVLAGVEAKRIIERFTS